MVAAVGDATRFFFFFFGARLTPMLLYQYYENRERLAELRSRLSEKNDKNGRLDLWICRVKRFNDSWCIDCWRLQIPFMPCQWTLTENNMAKKAAKATYLQLPPKKLKAKHILRVHFFCLFEGGQAGNQFVVARVAGALLDVGYIYRFAYHASATVWAWLTSSISRCCYCCIPRFSVQVQAIHMYSPNRLWKKRGSLQYLELCKRWTLKWVWRGEKIECIHSRRSACAGECLGKRWPKWCNIWSKMHQDGEGETRCQFLQNFVLGLGDTVSHHSYYLPVLLRRSFCNQRAPATAKGWLRRGWMAWWSKKGVRMRPRFCLSGSQWLLICIRRHGLTKLNLGVVCFFLGQKNMLVHRKPRWWFQRFCIFTSYWGKWYNLTSIFFNWVGSTTN